VTFGLLFALNNALGVALNFVANRFLRNVGSRKLAAAGLAGSLVGTVLTFVVWSLGAPVWVVAACITISMATIGLNGPNLVGLALNQVTTSTGSAAATIGFVQFCVGSIVSPLVGLGGSNTIVPMSVAMMALAGGSLAVLVLMPRARPVLRV
jgi:DHA1 family bicyclomycin/chloramphenicol resistance-like MFS transporter